jgi:lipoic acid synthetase
MREKKPNWLRIKDYDPQKRIEVEQLLKNLSLHTVCEEANCPNLCECFGKKTATFMILGDICTRNCTFCAVKKVHSSTLTIDPNEPKRIAEAVSQLSLKHVVITSVTRDDLDDGGANHFAECIRQIKEKSPSVTIEVLIPDFQGNSSSLAAVTQAQPEIINHNIETIPRLYDNVRPMADYQRSLDLLKNVKGYNPNIFTKSGIMVGLGETRDEVISTLSDLRGIKCDFVTIGQYLSPSRNHHPVVEYIHPNIFEEYKKTGLEMGFKHISAGPLVRSSYHAAEALR